MLVVSALDGKTMRWEVQEELLFNIFLWDSWDRCVCICGTFACARSWCLIYSCGTAGTAGRQYVCERERKRERECVCVCVCVARLHVCMYSCMYVCMAYICMCMYICVHMCICAYLHMCFVLFAHSHTCMVASSLMPSSLLVVMCASRHIYTHICSLCKYIDAYMADFLSMHMHTLIFCY
jgi:hypothetical protein